MKLTDYLAQFLKIQGIQTVYGVTGGAVVHLFDSAQRFGLQCVFTHHEQSAAFAVGAHARLKGLGAGFFTTGPGCSNALTGVAAAWLDSIPTLYFGGQVRSNHIKSCEIRQQGAQELDIVSIMRPLTKYAKTLEAPEAIEEELRTCLRYALSDRPGPVYLEIPLDFQWAEIEPKHSFVKIEKSPPPVLNHHQRHLEGCFNDISQAKTPLFLIGQGVKLSGAAREMQQLLDVWQVPFISTWNASDGLETSNPLYLGSPGMFGTREANMAIQKADLLCCIGTHLPVPVTTGNFDTFAPHAKIIVINIDEKELKHQRVKVDHAILLDAKDFIGAAKAILTEPLGSFKWRQDCLAMRKSFFREKASMLKESGILDTYSALDFIFESSKNDDIFVVDGGGTIVQATFQSIALKPTQKLMIDAGLCSMGSGLPQAVGAAFASPGHRIFCFCGDGSFQFNVQELQTIFHHQLPIKLCVFNNQGYLSIRHTQKEFLEENYLGSGKAGGISMPSIQAIAKAYQMPSQQIQTLQELSEALKDDHQIQGPQILEIMVPSESEMIPRIGFQKTHSGKFSALPIDQMHPQIEVLSNL